MTRGMTVPRYLLLGLVLWAAPVAAQTYPLGVPLTAAWDATSNEAAAGVDRYRVLLDAVALPDVTVLGRPTYSVALPQARLTLGAHTVTVQACAATVCTDAALTFSVGRPVPNAVPNLRVTPASTLALTVPQAIDYVQAYALWAVDRRLSDSELAWLAQRHGNVAPTKASVARVLEQAWAEVAPR